MTDDGRPAASSPVPIGPPRPAVAFGAGVAFGQLPTSMAPHPAGDAHVDPATSQPPAVLDPPPASSLPCSDVTDPFGMSGTSSGAPSPQKSVPNPGSLRAASHPGWSLPPVAPRAHRRGVSSDASSLGHVPGLAAAAALAAGGVTGGDDRPRSSSAGSGQRQRAAPPPTAASLVRAEESENRLRRGQSLLMDEAHTAGGIAQVCVSYIGLMPACGFNCCVIAKWGTGSSVVIEVGPCATCSADQVHVQQYTEWDIQGLAFQQCAITQRSEQEAVNAAQAVAAARAAAKLRSRLGQQPTEGGLRKQISLPKNAVVSGSPGAVDQHSAAPVSVGVSR